MKESFDVEDRHNDADITEAESYFLHSDTTKAQPLSKRFGLIAFFTALNVGAILLIYLQLKTKSLFPNPFPSMEYEIRSFAEEYNRDTSVPELWYTRTDYPPGDGYTFIENAGAYGLPPGVVINGKPNRYGTAWTHQYHCLEYIHTVYEATVYNVTLDVLSPHDQIDNEGQDAAIHHMRHCFDYLRQHIICTMDMRLEYPTTNPKGINGYQIPRKCVKREPLDKYMGEHDSEVQ